LKAALALKPQQSILLKAPRDYLSSFWKNHPVQGKPLSYITLHAENILVISINYFNSINIFAKIIRFKTF